MAQDQVPTSGDSPSRTHRDTPGDLMSQECQLMTTASQNTTHERGKQNSLTGAAKRRLKKLLAQGVEYARARELCKQPVTSFGQGSTSDPATVDNVAEGKRGQKRNRSEEFSPKENPKKSTKLETARPTFKEVISAIKIGIKAEDRLMSETELSQLQASILVQIDDEAPDGGVGPRFIACSHRDGWLCITCLNEHSQKWLTERVNSLKPWEDAKLAVMLEKDFPRPYIGVAWIPGPPEDPKRILQRIKFQNHHLDCARWRLLNSTPGEKGQHITFSMAQSSYEVLQKHGFTIWLAFGPITVRIKTPKAHASEAAPIVPAEQREPTGTLTAQPENRQSDTATTARLIATPAATAIRGGDANVFDPQQPGPSGVTQAPTRAPAVAPGTGGMAQVLTREHTAASRTQRGQKGISGASLGPANPKPTTLGRIGSGRATSAHQQTMPSHPRGATWRGRGRGTSKVPGAKKPTPKAFARFKP